MRVPTDKLVEDNFEIRPDGSIYIFASNIQADGIIIPPAVLDMMFTISKDKRTPNQSN